MEGTKSTITVFPLSLSLSSLVLSISCMEGTKSTNYTLISAVMEVFWIIWWERTVIKYWMMKSKVKLLYMGGLIHCFIVGFPFKRVRGYIFSSLFCLLCDTNYK